MAVAGNTTGAGGAKNIARATRKRPPSQADRLASLEKALPKVTKAPPPAPKRVTLRTPAQAQGASERKRAKRVELSAQRKRVGSDRPILVNRRAKVAAQAELAGVLQQITAPRLPRPRAPERSALSKVRHAAGEAIGEAAHVAGQAITGAGGVAGAGLEQAVTGDFYLKHLGLKAPEGGASAAVRDIIRNAPADAAEIAVTTPSSVAKVVSTAAHDPQSLPALLAEPYKQLAKDPGKFIREHPVSTALMLSPAVKVPGRVAGRVARRAGKTTLERPAATLPGTPLREARTGQRGVVGRRLQARRDKGAEAPQMTQKQVERRADEVYDYARQRRPQVAQSAAREAERRGYDAEQTKTHISGALGGDLAHQFLKEFGDTPPDYAVRRLTQHQAVGTSKAAGAKVFRVGGRSFRGAVLPASVKWLTGQVIEPVVRSVATGTGPTSLLREHRTFKALERAEPGAGVAFRQRTSGGGQFSLQGTAREFQHGKSLAEEFPESTFAAGVSRTAALPGIRHVRGGWRRYSNFVFDGVNGVIERTARRAMTGKAIATGALMERHLLTLSDAAIQDAAHGLRHTENQFALGRAVNDMYGQYQKFSPKTRETLLHTTPFAPWYFNTVNFLFRVLPRDHPVTSALLADTSAATEEWRKAHGLSLRGGDRKPGFLLGSYPVGDADQVVRFGHYTPALPADPAAAVADLVLPQFMGPIEALKGVDYRGQPIPGGVGKHIEAAALSAAQAHVPGAGQVSRYVAHKGKPRQKLRQEFDPFRATGGSPRRGRAPKDVQTEQVLLP